MKAHLRLLAVLTSALLASCQQPTPPLPHLPPISGNAAAAPRISGGVGAASAPAAAELAYGTSPAAPHGAAPPGGPGEFTLDFADTDLREVVAQILGTMLGANYAIDPTVRGTVTLHTSRPLSRAQLIPMLQALLAQNGASLVQTDGFYRVVPAAAAGAADTMVLPLRYTSAEELAKVLTPLIGTAAHVAADNASNALVVVGDAGQRESIADLVATFDTNALAGQSYALLPVDSGNAHDFADAMQEAFRGRSGGALAGLVRVVPMSRLNAVLIVSTQPRYIDEARRVFALVDRQRRRTVRSWHVQYLENSPAEDTAYTLQMAFTPNNVTAAPTSQASGSNRLGGAGSAQRSGFGGMGGGAGGGMGGGGAGGLGSGGLAAGGLASGGIGTGLSSGNGAAGLAGGGIGGGTGNTLGNATGRGGTTATAQGATANPLLGGLDQSGGGGGEEEDTMRILPDAQNNAVLIYATPQEEDTVLAMLRKLDLLPLQVRIDATIAEVTLNDALQYGTQFFFKSGGINGILNNATGPVGNPAGTVLGTAFPGFFLGGHDAGGAPIALSALQSVTTVNVLSSPQLTVVDNQPARLQVGNLVPYLTSSSQSTITSNAPIVNSVNYQPTGVIMEVTPRVNSGGLVTLDISQEVSDVDTTAPTTSGIDSPTFLERSVTSRVVVQDGQTLGIAGLIRDNSTRGNAGIPWLKDIPILGVLAGTQTNSRQRTELIVLLTPHVIHDQRDARALTQDLREALGRAAAAPSELQSERVSGSDDPNQVVRDRTRKWIEKELGTTPATPPAPRVPIQ